MLKFNVRKNVSKVQNYLPDINKNYLWAGLIIVGISVGLYYWGKNNGTVQQYPIPDESGTNPLTTEELNEISEIANNIHTSIDSNWNFITGWDLTPLKKLATESDRIFIGIYNFYNKSFLSAPDTLYTALRSEWAWMPPSVPFLNNSEGTRQLFESLFARFDRLSMK